MDIEMDVKGGSEMEIDKEENNKDERPETTKDSAKKGEAHKFYMKVDKEQEESFGNELDMDQINFYWESLCSQNATKDKKEFLKSCILYDSDENFINAIGLLLKEDSRIMCYLDYLLDLILNKCALSGNPSALLASASVIYALLLNPNCKLTFKQRMDLSEYSILMFLKDMDKETFDTLIQRIPLLLLELVKVNGDVNRDCFCGMVNLLGSILVNEEPIDCRIICGLLEALISMGSGALFFLIPKCFSNLCKVIDENRSMLRKQKPIPVDFSRSEKGVAIFMNKMDEITAGVHLYWKLCDACEILLTNFFTENFTKEGVDNSLSGLSHGETQWNYTSLEPFFASCLSYFGIALTSRLSRITTQSNLTQFLGAKLEKNFLLVHNNQYMDVGTLLRSTLHEQKLETKLGLKKFPSAPKADQEQIDEKFKNLELRCGLINASRIDEDKVSDNSGLINASGIDEDEVSDDEDSGLIGITPRTLKNAENLKVPDFANTALLDYLSEKAEGRYVSPKHWETTGDLSVHL